MNNQNKPNTVQFTSRDAQAPKSAWSSESTQTPPIDPSGVLPDGWTLPPANPFEQGKQQSNAGSRMPDHPMKHPVTIPPTPGYKQEVPVSPPIAPTPRSFGTPTASRRGKRPFKFINLLICLLVLAGVGTYFWLSNKQNGANVTLYQVEARNVTQYVGGGGIIYPRQQLDITYPVVERIVSVFVKAGDQVSVNQSLIQLDPAQLNAQIKQASDEVAAAQAFLNAISASGNAITIAQAQQAFNNAKSKYDALVAEAASPLLHNGNLISPMKGVITTLNINPGEVFAANTPLLTIMDESTVIVHVKVPLANFGQVHLGQAAIVTPSALPGQNFNGSVSAIIPQADPQTDTFEVWVAISNSEKLLLPGMSAFVRIQAPAQALVVPRLAVLNPDRESTVFVVRDQRVYLRQVHVLGRSTDALLVDKGLAVGDKVVLVGQSTLQNGQRVSVG